jgi:hypothetical protein
MQEDAGARGGNGGCGVEASTRDPHFTQNLATAGSSHAQFGQNIAESSPDVRSVILETSI